MECGSRAAAFLVSDLFFQPLQREACRFDPMPRTLNPPHTTTTQDKVVACLSDTGPLGSEVFRSHSYPTTVFTMRHNTRINRRHFLNTAGTALAFPYITGTLKGNQRPIVGEGDYRYEVIHDWARLPDRFSWQTTHNVAVDRDGFLYVIHEGRSNLTDHPAIFVFDPKGQFVRAFGSQFQGGGHGLEVRDEDGEQYLYVTAYQHLKRFAKLTLRGETVWEHRAPMDSGRYASGEAQTPTGAWGRDRFMPTNFAFHPDGGFYVADGYGAWTIHRYNAAGEWVANFGKPGKGDGEFNLPHGIWLDTRPGRQTSVAVADRANGRLQWFTLGGDHLETVNGFILPANLDTYQNLMLVPDLSARVTLLNEKNEIVAHLGEDPAWRDRVLADNRKLRRQPANWASGRFLHPHDACFDENGDIYVAEWVHSGRISKLRRIG